MLIVRAQEVTEALDGRVAELIPVPHFMPKYCLMRSHGTSYFGQ